MMMKMILMMMMMRMSILLVQVLLLCALVVVANRPKLSILEAPSAAKLPIFQHPLPFFFLFFFSPNTYDTNTGPNTDTNTDTNDTFDP